MNPQKLLLLVLVMVAAISVLFYLNTRDPLQPNSDDRIEDQQAALFESATAKQVPTILKGDFANLQHIVLHRAEDFSMVKLVPGENELWDMLEPMQDRAESGLAIALANLLFDTAALPKPVEWENHSMAELGLEQPRFDLEVLFQDGSEERLQFGARVPQTSNHFALLGDELIQVPAQLVDLTSRDPSHWRDHGVFRWPHLLRHLEWHPQEGPAIVLIRPGNHWQLEEPIQGAVDPLRVKFLLRLLGSRVNGLPSDRLRQEEKTSFSENAGQLIVSNEVVGAGPTEQRFWIFNQYALDQNRDYLLAMNQGDFRFFGLSLEEMRSSRLVDFDPNHISSIRLILNSQEVVLQRQRGGWAHADGRTLTSAANNKLTTLLRYLSILETNELVQADAQADVQSILLSQSRTPVQRGSVQLRYSMLADGRSAISALGSRQNYAADRNLDEEWQAVLQFNQN
ncbi:MAG: DUF4340 domain-containing protein [Planctomycetes bacterium]|nr:DUF4340 domain-containing protein [Planctomycetota bacterium]